MLIESKREGRYYSPLVWSIASMLAVCGVALAILMISAVLGPFRFLDPTASGGSATFGLWLRGGVGDMASPQSMKRLVAWRGVAPVDVPFRESRTLERLMEEKVGVLAIPDARSLSRGEAVELRRFLMDGGGVILTGSVGVVDDEGQWRGYDLMKSLLEVESVTPLSSESSGSLVAARRGPLAVELEPEERLELIAEPGVPAIENPNAEMQWSVDLPQGNAAQDVDASRRVEVGRGRLVWLAAGPESAVQAGAEPWRAMVRLMRSAAAWAARRSQIEVLPWPNGAPSAAAMDDSAALSRDLREVDRAIHRADRSGSLLVLPPAVQEQKSALRVRLAARGAWLAESGEIFKWRQARERISARSESIGSSRLLVAVSNQGSDTARGVTLRIHLGHRASEVELRGTTVGQNLPEKRFRSGSAHVDLVLGDLPRRANRAFTVDFMRFPYSENAQRERKRSLQISATTPISTR